MNCCWSEKARSSRPGRWQNSLKRSDYRKKTGELLEGLAQDVHCEENTPAQDKEEADLLYAEYAMDFATLAMQQALISALGAL